MKKKEIYSQRKKEIYGNCRVHHPDGTLMFLCIEKRAKWYLDRNLATVMKENPLTIQLTFEPSGKGAGELEGDDMKYMLGQKSNACVVCGSEDISRLTRHHIVPNEYRRLFPVEIKTRASHDVVAICRKDHAEYENNYAIKLKRELEKSFGVESAESVYGGLHKWVKANKYAKMLLDADMVMRLPQSRIDYFTKEIRRNFGNMSLNEIAEIDALSVLRERTESVSQRVVEKLQGDPKLIFEFTVMWRKHFVESMNPQFLPEGWNVEHGADRVEDPR